MSKIKHQTIVSRMQCWTENIFSCFLKAGKLATSRSGIGRLLQACGPEYENARSPNPTVTEGHGFRFVHGINVD